MISSVRPKQSISWTFLNDAMALFANEMPKNHNDKAAASSCISIRNGKSSIPYAYAYSYAYAYVTPVHTYFSYFSYAYVYACAYAYVKV